jgi:integrase
VPRTRRFTETHIRDAPQGRTHVFDTPGLYLYVSPKDLKRWIFRYSRPQGAGVTEISLGKLPYTSLARAREIVSHFRRFLNDGIDPQDAKRWQHAESMTFVQLAQQWIDNNKLNPKRLQDARNLLLVHGKSLANEPLIRITPEKIHSALATLWDEHPDQAKRARAMIWHVLSYARVKRLRPGENPATWKGNLEHLFPRRSKAGSKHHGSMPYHQVPAFLRELRTHRGSVAAALEFCILTATRSNETLGMQWSEIDWTQCIWIVPDERVNTNKKRYRVPLSNRTIELLTRQQERSVSQFVFTGNNRDQPLSERTMYFLLRTMAPGVTVHGFRASFRNWCAHTFPRDRDLAELCLGHTVKGQTEGAYWTDDMLEQRRPIMEAWAKYCGSYARS